MSFDFLRAIKRPFTDFNKLSIGVILLIIPFINIITGFFVKGYKLESARTAMNKKFAMPVWEKWWLLFLRGILSWVIAIIYMLPAVILILISIGKVLYNILISYGLNQGLSINNQLSNQLIQNSLMENTFMIPLFLIAILLGLLAAYLTPIAIMRYVDKYRFNDAFSLDKVFKKAFTGKYFIAILAAVIYSTIIGLISIALNMGFSSLNIQILTSIISLIIGGLSSFIVMITSYTIFGEVYQKIK